MNTRAATQTTHLGRYCVVKRLAAGGMADVLLARTDGIEGFQRHVVIKRIHAELLEEQRYVKMFLDEARLAASLHHHNIVQVNDIGEENGEYFFAMEYVHGEDARTLLVEASQREQEIPLEHIVTIIMAAAAGLHHAHEQRGQNGQALNIVHRDVSPANILVGYDGAVKVADFGIALASHRAEQTQSGVLKGKVAYMSPEQCNCDPVDRRSDVFSLGICLYELVTVRPCFAGDNDFMTMSAIVGGKLDRPSLHRKDLPPELEAIILKALATKPANRYQTADELRMALEEFAASTKLRTSTTALADYMKTQFGARALPWQEDDEEPEIEMGAENGDAPARHTTPLPPRVPTQVHGSLEVAPRRERASSPTMPMRAQDDDLAIPLAPRDREDGARPPVTAMESDPPAKPTLPLRTVSRAPAQLVTRTQTGPVDARAPAATEAQSPLAKAAQVMEAVSPPVKAALAPVARAVQTPAPKNHRLWLAGSVAAVLVAGISLVVVSGGNHGRSAPRASAAPAAHKQAVAPQPLERPVVHESIEPMTAPAPAKKSHHGHRDAKDAAKAAAPGEVKAAEASPVETKATEPKAVDARPAETKPAEMKPAETKPAEAKPAETKPAKKWDPDKLFPK